MKVTTSTGFTCEANEKIKNDFRFIEALAMMEGGEASEALRGQVDMLRLLLPKDAIKALYAHVREEDGTVPTDRVIAECMEIIQGIGKGEDVKN